MCVCVTSHHVLSNPSWGPIAPYIDELIERIVNSKKKKKISLWQPWSWKKFLLTWDSILLLTSCVTSLDICEPFTLPSVSWDNQIIRSQSLSLWQRLTFDFFVHKSLSHSCLYFLANFIPALQFLQISDFDVPVRHPYLVMCDVHGCHMQSLAIFSSRGCRLGCC